MSGSVSPAVPLHVQQAILFNKENRIGEDTPLAPGYKDGGRQAEYNSTNGKTIIQGNRETVTFKDPKDDPSLKRVIDQAKTDMAGLTSTAAKAAHLNQLVDKLLHQSNPELNEKILNQIPLDAEGKRRISLGDLIDNQTGVCRHRTLLFKVLADNTGVPAAIVRGNFREGDLAGGHAWNEVKLEDGKKLLVDVMHQKTIDMNDPYARNYYDSKNRPMYDEKGLIHHTPSQSASQPKSQDASFDEIRKNIGQRMIADATPTHTNKGVYLGIGKSPEEVGTLRSALQVNGYEEGKHFTVSPSSQNQGNDVIKLTEAGNDKLMSSRTSGSIPEQSKKIEPKSMTSESAMAMASQNARAELAQIKPKPLTPEFAMAAASVDARRQLADPTYKAVDKTAEKPATKAPTPVDIDLSESEPAHKSSAPAHASGAKVDKAAGYAGTAARAGEKLSHGDTTGAAVVVAEEVGTNLAIKKGTEFVAKRIPVVGAVVTAGMTLWSAGVEAKQGNWGKAGAEIVAGGAEAAGNIVGFGAGDALREGTREVIKRTAGEKYAPEKSGLRQAGELAAKVVTDARYKSMGMAELGKAIQTDETLPDTVKLHGKDVTLVEAMKDKDFRGGLIKNLESAQAKGNELSDQIAMVKAYDSKLVEQAKKPAPMTEEPVIAKNTAPSISAPMA